MDTVTYPDKQVSELINDLFIPLRLKHNEQPLAGEFHVTSTPTIITLDRQRQERHRIQGFMPPEEFIPALLLSIAKVNVAGQDFRQALPLLERIEKNFTGSSSTAEAIYLAGICRYKISSDPVRLKETYEKLKKNYPDSDWTKQAAPYRLF